MSPPVVSVVMPVYKVERYVEAAVRSVLAQRFSDFELIVVDDASPDDSIARVQAIGDARIRIARHPHNRGLAQTRNTGIDAARGAFIALLDSDDVAPPDRLSRQVAYLAAHPDVVMLGGGARFMDGQGTLQRAVHLAPSDPGDVHACVPMRNPLFVSTLMFRRAPLGALRYDPRFTMAEDYDFNARVASIGAIANLPRVLLHYRVHPTSLTSTKPQAMEVCVRSVITRELAALGITPSEREMEVHRHLTRLHLPASIALLEEIDAWLDRYAAATRAARPVLAEAVERVCGQAWFESCTAASALGAPIWRCWRSGRFAHAIDRVPAQRIAKFRVKTWAGLPPVRALRKPKPLLKTPCRSKT